ncbi:MAG: hypothetical protein FWE95_09385, partial [Planctomycetaceae bacterium]|nr:hypothetical protein [Planctomycetaceae bacterium]
MVRTLKGLFVVLTRVITTSSGNEWKPGTQRSGVTGSFSRYAGQSGRFTLLRSRLSYATAALILACIFFLFPVHGTAQPRTFFVDGVNSPSTNQYPSLNILHLAGVLRDDDIIFLGAGGTNVRTDASLATPFNVSLVIQGRGIISSGGANRFFSDPNSSYFARTKDITLDADFLQFSGFSAGVILARNAVIERGTNTFTGNAGGRAIDANTVSFRNGTNTFSGNTGGAIYAYSNFIISNGTNTFSDNSTSSAYSYGGAAVSAERITIEGGTNEFSGNQVGGVGGALYTHTDSRTISIIGGTNTFENNTAGVYGGAIGTPLYGTVSITGGINVFSGNWASATYGAGGAIGGSAGTGSVAITGGTNTFFGNITGGTGGAINIGATGTFRATNGDFIFGAFRTNDGDFIFQGNRAGVDAAGNGGTANAIHHTGTGTNTLTLAAESGRHIYFFDPVTTSTISGSTTRSISINPLVTDTGTVVFDGSNYTSLDDRSSRIDGATTVGYGTLALKGSVAYGTSTGINNTNNIFTLGQNAIGQNATLLTDNSINNRIQANSIRIHGTVDIASSGVLQLAVGTGGTARFENATFLVNNAGGVIPGGVGRIDVTGVAIVTGERTTINFAEWKPGRYTLLTATGGAATIENPEILINREPLGARQARAVSRDPEAETEWIIILGEVANETITWRGQINSTWDTTTENWLLGTENETFVTGDSVVFDSTAPADRRNVAVIPGGVTVNTMTVSDAYTFTGGAITSTGGVTVNTGGTLRIGNGGTTGSVTGNITVSGGSAVFNRSNAITYAGVLSGNGNVSQEGAGALTLNGNSSAFAGTFTQTAGTVNLSGGLGGTYAQTAGIVNLTGNHNGTFNQSAGATLNSTNGATLNNATFAGTVNPTGTLNISGTANFTEATLHINLGANNDRIAVTGAVSSGGVSIINIGTWATGTFTILTATAGGIVASNFTVDPSSVGSRQSATLSNPTANELRLTTSSTNTDLVWTGGTNGNWNTTTDGNWRLANPPGTPDRFNPNDYVIFDGTSTNNNIVVDTSGVQVAGMRITGGDYTFSGGTLRGVDPAPNGQTVTGKLDITDGSATFSNAEVNFVNGMDIASAATVTLGNGGNFGSTMQIANAGTLQLNRSDNFTFTNRITGNGTVRQTGSGTVTLRGQQSGRLEQTAGTINLAGTWTGGFVQTAGILTGNGTLTGNAHFSGIVAPTGTLSIGGTATFADGSTYQVNLGSTNTLLAVTGNVNIMDGAQLIIEGLAGTEGEKFNVITASGFIGELFSVVDTGTRFFHHGIDPAANGYVYWVSWTSRPPDDGLFDLCDRATPNARRAAEAMKKIGSGTLYSQLANMDKSDPCALADAFAQLHGEVFAGNKDAAAQMQRRFLQRLPSALERQLCC